MMRSTTPRLLLLAASMSTIMALAACGGDYNEDKTLAPMPPISEMDAAMNAPAPQPQPLSPSDTLTPVMPTALTGAPPSAAVTPSAVSDGGSVESRIARLEQTVGSLRSDYDRIMPAFASLNTTNERIQTLLDEIEKETGNRPDVVASSGMTPAPMAGLKTDPAPVVSTTVATTTTTTTKTEPPAAAPKATVSAMPAAPGANTVTSIRIGEHGTKTRLVMDLTSKTKPDFKYDLDNGEKLLIVDLPSSAWSGAESGKAASSPMIESWSVQKGANGGSTVAIQLKKSARILSTEFLKAEGKDPARLVMDIAAGG